MGTNTSGKSGVAAASASAVYATPGAAHAAEGEAPRASVPILPAQYVMPFVLVTTLFFSWALAAQLNDVLIRQFQKALDLTRGQSGLIQTAFYGGYFLGAIPAGLVMRRFGYKSGILVGLSLYCLGALLFYPAAEVRWFGFFLGALYIIAFGLSFLETAANPFVSVLGPAQTGPARLNLAQSFYGIGAFLGPFLGGLFIFSGIEHTQAELHAMTPASLDAYRAAEAHAVQLPYLGLAGAIALLAILIALTRFPKIEESTTAVAGSGAAGPDGPGAGPAERSGAGAVTAGSGSDAASGSATGSAAATSWRDLLHFRHLKLAVITQFIYVGTQVTIWSYFIDFTKDLSPGTGEKAAARLLSFGFLALMIGRFSGAFIMRRWPAARLLTLYAAANIVLVGVAMTASGWVAIGALWLTTFFMSIMFPTIFALGVRGLGPLTKLGSSLMIMAIIGGAIFPPLVGHLADAFGSLQLAMLIPLLGFAAVLAFGLAGHQLARAQAESPSV